MSNGLLQRRAYGIEIQNYKQTIHSISILLFKVFKGLHLFEPVFFFFFWFQNIPISLSLSRDKTKG